MVSFSNLKVNLIVRFLIQDFARTKFPWYVSTTFATELNLQTAFLEI